MEIRKEKKVRLSTEKKNANPGNDLGSFEIQWVF